MKHNPFPDVDGCAKLPWFRRGLRFTVSLRTGVVFLGDRTSVRVMTGSDKAAFERGHKAAEFTETALRRKNSSIDDLGQAAVT